MSIKRTTGGFYEWHDYIEGTPGLGISSKRLDACIAHYHERGFGGLFGHPDFGFRQDNLDFLSRTNDAQWLWFWDISLNSIDGIYDLNNLQNIGIHPKRPGIDYSRLTSLRTAFIHWSKSDSGIAESKITEYRLWHYKPKSKSFAELAIPKGVKELELGLANPADLSGLPVMKNLKAIVIRRCHKLQDLSALPRIAPKLQKLLITSSSRIEPTAGILDHPTLKMALINGRFVVGDSG